MRRQHADDVTEGQSRPAAGSQLRTLLAFPRQPPLRSPTALRSARPASASLLSVPLPFLLCNERKGSRLGPHRRRRSAISPLRQLVVVMRPSSLLLRSMPRFALAAAGVAPPSSLLATSAFQGPSSLPSCPRTVVAPSRPPVALGPRFTAGGAPVSRFCTSTSRLR